MSIEHIVISFVVTAFRREDKEKTFMNVEIVDMSMPVVAGDQLCLLGRNVEHLDYRAHRRARVDISRSEQSEDQATAATRGRHGKNRIVEPASPHISHCLKQQLLKMFS